MGRRDDDVVAAHRRDGCGDEARGDCVELNRRRYAELPADQTGEKVIDLPVTRHGRLAGAVSEVYETGMPTSLLE